MNGTLTNSRPKRAPTEMNTLKVTATLTAPPAKKEKMSDEKALSFALGVISTHFTMRLIAALENSKLAGFKDPAEHCLERVNEKGKTRRWLAFWATITSSFIGLAILLGHLLGGISAILHDWQTPTLMVLALVTGFITLIFCSNLGPRLGDTTKLVAKAWRPWRTKVIASDLASKLGDAIQWHLQYDMVRTPLVNEIEGWSYGGEELRKKLESVHAKLADDVASSFRAAERDGTRKNRKRLRNEFGMLDKVGQKLGLAGLDWKLLDNS